MRRLALSVALLALFGVSVAGKVVTATRVQAAEANHATPGIDLLRARGMAVSLPASDVAPAWITGTNGECRVRIARISPQGWSRAIVERQASGEALSFAFAGRFYLRQPVLKTRMENYWRRLMRHFGIPIRRIVVRAVAVSPGCPSDAIRPEDAKALSS